MSLVDDREPPFASNTGCICRDNRAPLADISFFVLVRPSATLALLARAPKSHAPLVFDDDERVAHDGVDAHYRIADIASNVQYVPRDRIRDGEHRLHILSSLCHLTLAFFCDLADPFFFILPGGRSSKKKT